MRVSVHRERFPMEIQCCVASGCCPSRSRSSAARLGMPFCAALLFAGSLAAPRDEIVFQQRVVQSPCKICCRGATAPGNRLVRERMALCEVGSRAKLLDCGRGWP